jgi:hypothetical protein
MNADEARLALAQYVPFAMLDQIAKTSAILVTEERGDAAVSAAVAWFLKQL